MKYSFTLPGRNNLNIDVEISFFTGKHTVWINGELANHYGNSKKIFEVPVSKKNVKTLRVQPNVMDLGLTVFYNGEKIQVTESLSFVDYVLAYAPFFVGVFAANILNTDLFGGAAIGFLSILISLSNIRILRGTFKEHMKTLSMALVSFGAFGVYYLVSLIEKNLFS